MFENRLRNLKLLYPRIVEGAVEFIDNGPFEIVVKMENGETLSYDDLYDSVRRLPSNSREMTEEECRKEFGYRLRQMMTIKNVNQLELSERTGINQPTLSNYINGKTSPTLYNIDRIAKALGCSIDAFTYNK